MIALVILALIQSEPLPIDAVMTAYEEAMPSLKEVMAKTEAEIGIVGPREAGWETSAHSATIAIAAGNGSIVQHVLGEWEKGGHGVAIPGDLPLSVPVEFHRYVVREYKGPIDYHSYHRLTGGIVIHTYGAATKRGNAECQRTQGIELISPDEWHNWLPQTALVAFGTARATRDDDRTYCLLYRPVADGGFVQIAYTSNGQPYVALNGDRQVFKVTSRAEAASRIFANEGSSLEAD